MANNETSSSPLESDPNGLAALVLLVVGAAVAAFHLAVSSSEARSIADGIGALITLAGILVARVKAWAPNTVRALTPANVGPAGELPAVPVPPAAGG